MQVNHQHVHLNSINANNPDQGTGQWRGVQDGRFAVSASFGDNAQKVSFRAHSVQYDASSGGNAQRTPAAIVRTNGGNDTITFNPNHISVPEVGDFKGSGTYVIAAGGGSDTVNLQGGNWKPVDFVAPNGQTFQAYTLGDVRVILDGVEKVVEGSGDLGISGGGAPR
jgi:hypothetical protein